MFNFGILGCGMIANVHADAIKRIENATLVGAADNKVEFAQNFAVKHGVKAYETYEEMLNDKNIDVVCICTPSCFHTPNAIQALESGKHVVLEKPMSFTTAEADELIKTCERTGKMLTVISQLRFSKDVQRLKKLIEENAFGKISLCNLFMKYYRSEGYYSTSPWKGTKKFDGGGALMNQGIHGVDLLQYIVGKVKTVHGAIRTISHAIEVEDTATAQIEFENGALGVIVGSTCAYPGFERRIEIHGDKGYAILTENNLEKLMVNGEEISLEKGKTTNTANDPTAVDCYYHQLQIQNLLNAVQGKEPLLVDCQEGKKAVEIIEKIYNS